MILNGCPLKQQMKLSVDTRDFFCMARDKNSSLVFAVMPEISTDEGILML